MLQDVNPLNVFGLRRIEHAPPHFESVVFDLRTTEKAITDWIHEHLYGRFFFGEHYYLDDKQHVHKSAKVSFELHSEASYFGLFLDQINQPNTSW